MSHWLWVSVAQFIAYVIILFVLEKRAAKRGHERGLKEGYQRGFTDAQIFSELWWQVAENDVETERVKIWKEESRWP